MNSFFESIGKDILSPQRPDIYRFVTEHSKKHDRSTKEPGKLATVTIRRLLADLRRFYDFCDRFNIQYSGDRLALERMRYMRCEPPPITTPLSFKEIRQVLQAPLKQIYRLIRLLVVLHILYASGIRISELLRLKVSDIDLDENTMRVIGKGDIERIGYITDECAGFIRLYLETARASYAVRDNPYLIAGQNCEGPMSKSQIESEVKELADAGNFNKRIYPHLFRHTFANHLHEAGMDIRYIQELMGHKWCSTTQKHYLPEVSWNKLCREYSKLFKHKNAGLHLVKDRDPRPAILDHHAALKPQKKMSGN